MEDAGEPEPNSRASSVSPEGHGAIDGEAKETLKFSVTIRKTADIPLGIDVTIGYQEPRSGVFVSRVFPDGIVQEWNNQSQEPWIVRSGDCIYQVNDVLGAVPVDMIEEMQRKQELVLHVRRSSSSSALPGDGVSAADASLVPNSSEMGCGTVAACQKNGPVVSVEGLLPHLIALSDETLAALLQVAIERRPWLKVPVLGEGAVLRHSQPEEEHSNERPSQPLEPQAGVERGEGQQEPDAEAPSADAALGNTEDPADMASSPSAD